MVSIAAGDGRQRAPVKISGRRRAAGIYGIIVTAAIIAASGGEVSTIDLVIAVMLTLLVYWVAEEYAEVLGEQVEGGQLPTWARIRDSLAGTWPMVSASFLPLLAVVLARLAGASALVAANVGLGVAIMVLAVHGWLVSRAARLRGRQLVLSTSVAVALGLMMILLKDLILLHLH
jgi:uncharacterized membrane protein YqaE (UPF0057 family)